MPTYEFTEEAVRNIRNMKERLWEITNVFSTDSHEYRLAARSYIAAMDTLFAWPGKVFAEDDLSLIINSSITIGVIWHPKHTLNAEGEAVRDPVAGEWGCHS
jgi:hypothetical protein